MRNLLKTLYIFIGVLLISVSSFIFTHDTNGTVTENSVTELLNANTYIENSINLPNEGVDTSTVIIDNIYTQLVLEQFIADAVKNGLDQNEVIEHIKALDMIIVEDLDEYGLLGVTLYVEEPNSPTGMRGMIAINVRLLENPELYMFTLYHELGHWFGLPHCDCVDRIMMNGYDKDQVNEVFEEWDKKVKKMMKKIKKGYNRKDSHYDFPHFDKEDSYKEKHGMSECTTH